MKCPECKSEIGVLKHAGWSFDIYARKLRERPEIEWTEAEARVLTTLMKAKGKFVSRLQLLASCTHQPSAKLNLVNVIVYRINGKLDGLINNARNQGYYIMARS